jgi:hypothetical protein
MGSKIEVILHEGQCWFRSADVTRYLGYGNGRQAIINKVKQKDRITRDFLLDGADHSHAVYITENGVRDLVRRSRMPGVEDFELWVASVIDELKSSFSSRDVKSLIVQLTPAPSSKLQGADEPDSLYIMVNPLLPEIVKVGRSAFPDRRARQLSAGQPFQVEVKRCYSSKGFLEKTIHQKLERLRVAGGSGMEWFKLSVEKAACLIEATILEDELAKAQ